MSLIAELEKLKNKYPDLEKYLGDNVSDLQNLTEANIYEISQEDLDQLEKSDKVAITKSKSSQSTVEKAELEKSLMSKAEDLSDERGMNMSEAVEKVCENNPELYREFSRQTAIMEQDKVDRA